jgi:hypothetical protein
MGRSLREAGGGHDDLDRERPLSFVADGLTYTVANDGRRMIHREQRFDERGALVFEKSEEVAFAVGAGSRGRSYLIQRGDSLWMSPVTFYPQHDRWALSPGYEKYNYHFTRHVLPDCLFCHANRAQHRPLTLNRYDRPVFSGLTIGCERCHGPGELHAARHAGDVDVAEPDDTIVNPRRLAPVLRDGVCQQCHLAGAVRIVRRGRDRYDYRPGLPWHEFIAVFVKRPQSGELAAITSHDEQMRASRCHAASDGKLACISCHDPHRQPDPEEKVEYFRRRCCACHSETECRERQESRAATIPPDNCLACHMPAIASEVQHAVMTDHRIPRHAGEVPTPTPAPEGPGADWPLALFHVDQVDSDPTAERNFALALMELASKRPNLVSERHLTDVVPILERILERDADDIDAIEALAHALFLLKRAPDAMATIEEGIQRAPDHEQLLAGAVLIAVGNRDWDLAQDYAGRLLSLNPHEVRYRKMALQIATANRGPAIAVKACEAILDLNPADRETRQRLVELLQAQGQINEAQQQADILQRSPR